MGSNPTLSANLSLQEQALPPGGHGRAGLNPRCVRRAAPTISARAASYARTNASVNGCGTPVDAVLRHDPVELGCSAPSTSAAGPVPARSCARGPARTGRRRWKARAASSSAARPSPTAGADRGLVILGLEQHVAQRLHGAADSAPVRFEQTREGLLDTGRAAQRIARRRRSRTAGVAPRPP